VFVEGEDKVLEGRLSRREKKRKEVNVPFGSKARTKFIECSRSILDPKPASGRREQA